MSISHYSIYATGCIDLARSIIIKHDSTADAMNLIDSVHSATYAANGLAPFYDKYDKKTWRYYQNMAGIYHVLDLNKYEIYDPNSTTLTKTVQTKYIQVYSLDTYELIDFTVENLKVHRATRREYQKGSTYYRRLVDKYPDKRLLIDGILNPIDMDYAINARNNQILYYNKKLVEENEYHLMYKVQQFIDTYFARWNNEDYGLVDNLYIPTRTAIMYLFLPYVIMGYRYDASRTIEAHSFHVWNYLGSHQWLDEYRYHLNLYQRMWLYRNIEWSELNAGKIDTFRKHIDVIMTNRNLPISEFFSKKNYKDMEGNPDNFKPYASFERNPLNLEDQFMSSDKYRTIEDMVEAEIHEARDNLIDNNIVIDKDTARDAFTNKSDNSLPTKVVESRVHDPVKRTAIKKHDVELNEWIYMTTKGMYTARISIANPTTAEFMNMTQREALVVFVYALMKSQGLDPKLIPTITATNVLKLRKPDLVDIRKLMDGKLTSYTYAYAADSLVFEPEKIISTEEFSEFCQRVWKLRNDHRTLYSFSNDYREHAQVKTMIHQYYDTVVCQLTDAPMYFDDYFEKRGWSLFDTERDIMEGKSRWNRKLYADLAADVLKYATGNDLVQRMSVREIQGMMVRLLRKLSSYSIQLLQSIVEEEVTPVDWPYFRYSKLGQKDSHKGWLNMMCLDFDQFRNKLFHQFDKRGETLTGRPIHPDNSKLRIRHRDSIDLVIDITEKARSKYRNAYRFPTVSFKGMRSVIHTPTPGTTPINPWDMENFRIHATTEDRSFVEVDEKGTLYTSGVVYVKKDYKGKS